MNNTLGNTSADELSVETYIGRDGVIWRLVFRKGYLNFSGLFTVTKFRENTDN